MKLQGDKEEQRHKAREREGDQNERPRGISVILTDPTK